MDWTTFLTTGIGALIGSGIVTAVIERCYQSRLDTRLERLKDQLTRDAYSYQVRFSRLYALRVALLRRLYRLFVLADRAARRLLDRSQSIGTGLLEATGALADFGISWKRTSGSCPMNWSANVSKPAKFSFTCIEWSPTRCTFQMGRRPPRLITALQKKP
jgi:hypothetical protein